MKEFVEELLKNFVINLCIQKSKKSEKNKKKFLKSLAEGNPKRIPGKVLEQFPKECIEQSQIIS